MYFFGGGAYFFRCLALSRPQKGGMHARLLREVYEEAVMQGLRRSPSFREDACCQSHNRATATGNTLTETKTHTTMNIQISTKAVPIFFPPTPGQHYFSNDGQRQPNTRRQTERRRAKDHKKVWLPGGRGHAKYTPWALEGGLANVCQRQIQRPANAQSSLANCRFFGPAPIGLLEAPKQKPQGRPAA